MINHCLLQCVFLCALSTIIICHTHKTIWTHILVYIESDQLYYPSLCITHLNTHFKQCWPSSMIIYHCTLHIQCVFSSTIIHNHTHMYITDRHTLSHYISSCIKNACFGVHTISIIICHSSLQTHHLMCNLIQQLIPHLYIYVNLEPFSVAVSSVMHLHVHFQPLCVTEYTPLCVLLTITCQSRIHTYLHVYFQALSITTSPRIHTNVCTFDHYLSNHPANTAPRVPSTIMCNSIIMNSPPPPPVYFNRYVLQQHGYTPLCGLLIITMCHIMCVYTTMCTFDYYVSQRHGYTRPSVLSTISVTSLWIHTSMCTSNHYLWQHHPRYTATCLLSAILAP